MYGTQPVIAGDHLVLEVRLPHLLDRVWELRDIRGLVSSRSVAGWLAMGAVGRDGHAAARIGGARAAHCEGVPRSPEQRRADDIELLARDAHSVHRHRGCPGLAREGTASGESHLSLSNSARPPRHIYSLRTCNRSAGRRSAHTSRAATVRPGELNPCALSWN